MKKILLTQGLVALVDDRDWGLVSGYNWFAMKSTKTYYALTNSSRSLDSEGRQNKIRMHRLIMGAKLGEVIDHRDGNGLNNSRSNLRFATKSQNNRNSRLRADNSSGYKGVYWDRINNKWKAQIRMDGKRIGLGYFMTKEEAAIAYDEAATFYFNEFARTNF